MTTFNSRLREVVDLQRLTNRDVAAKIGVSSTNVNNILKGDNKPNVETVAKLVEALGVNGHWLLTGEGEMMWLNGQQPAGTVALQLSTGHQANNTQNVGDAAALAIAQERIKALEQVNESLMRELQSERESSARELATMRELVEMLKKRG